jgi:hypothetical protein
MCGLTRIRVVEVSGESASPDCALREAAPELRSDAAAEVIAALVGLGWSRADATSRLERARERLRERGEAPEATAIEVLLQESLGR